MKESDILLPRRHNSAKKCLYFREDECHRTFLLTERLMVILLTELTFLIYTLLVWCYHDTNNNSNQTQMLPSHTSDSFI